MLEFTAFFAIFVIFLIFAIPLLIFTMIEPNEPKITKKMYYDLVKENAELKSENAKLKKDVMAYKNLVEEKRKDNRILHNDNVFLFGAVQNLVGKYTPILDKIHFKIDDIENLLTKQEKIEKYSFVREKFSEEEELYDDDYFSTIQTVENDFNLPFDSFEVVEYVEPKNAGKWLKENHGVEVELKSIIPAKISNYLQQNVNNFNVTINNLPPTAEPPVVKPSLNERIAMLIEENKKYKIIAKTLNDEGYRTKQGKMFTEQIIKNIVLKNKKK